MLTQLQIQEIEKFRLDTTYKKYILVKLLNYWNEILKFNNEPNLPQECFCAEARKKEFHTEFFIFYDKQNIN